MVKTIDITITKKVGVITLCRPKKLNSFVDELYGDIGNTLNEMANDDRVVVALLTASGRFFSSGHDLGSQAKQMAGLDEDTMDMEKYLYNRCQNQAGQAFEIEL
jgi:enoyl-CoA hydratase/carnithine racemase